MTLRAISALFALTLAGCADSPSASQADLEGRPVVLIVFDALSAKHVGHLGYPHETTPNLDALAAEGVTYSQAFAPTPYTLASIASLFTGRLPDRHGVTQAEHVLPPAEVTLAESLAQRGYQTFGAIANIQGGPLHDLEQGFEVYEELYRQDIEGARAMEIVAPEAFNPVLQRWLMERDPERPPFLYLHVLQPHMPYDPPERFREGLIEPGYDGQFVDGMDRDWMVSFAESSGRMVPGKGKNRIPWADARAIQGLYDGSIRHVDAQLEVFLKALDAVDMLDEALVIVTSDHGESMWQHGSLGHSRQVYDEMVQVPLVVKFPDSAGVEPAVVDDLVSLMDVYPSVCAWLDLPAPQALDGRPLPGVFGQVGSRDRELYLRTFHRDPTVALRAHDSKAMLERDLKGGPERELAFDLTADPEEQDALSSPDPAAFARLRALRAELEALGAGTVRDEGPTAAEAALIQELGYAE